MDDQFYLFDPEPQPRQPWNDETEDEIHAVSVVFPEGIEKPLDYAIPPAWIGKVQKGMRLEVPLGYPIDQWRFSVLTFTRFPPRA